MADWNTPTLTTTYAAFLTALQERDVDAATMAESPTNPPNNYIRWNTALSKFQRWNGSIWVDLVLSGAGGGTGGTTPLGTMAVQNANAVAITGGSLSGVSVTLAGHLLFDADGTRNVGSNAQKANNVYIKNGLVIPVGVDKWVTS